MGSRAKMYLPSSHVMQCEKRAARWNGPGREAQRHFIRGTSMGRVRICWLRNHVRSDVVLGEWQGWQGITKAVHLLLDAANRAICALRDRTQ